MYIRYNNVMSTHDIYGTLRKLNWISNAQHLVATWRPHAKPEAYVYMYVYVYNTYTYVYIIHTYVHTCIRIECIIEYEAQIPVL